MQKTQQQQQLQKMLIIGATGLTGRHIVDVASRCNFQCTAFAPNINELGCNSTNVKCEKGDVCNLEDLRRVIQGQDVVVSAFGTGTQHDKPCEDRTRAYENIITVMKEKGVKRLIVVSGAGIANFTEDKLLCEMPNFPKDLQAITKDHLGAWNLIKNSGLQYTVFAAPTIKQGGQQQQSWQQGQQQQNLQGQQQNLQGQQQNLQQGQQQNLQQGQQQNLQQGQQHLQQGQQNLPQQSFQGQSNLQQQQSGAPIIRVDFFPQECCADVYVTDLAEAIVREARENKFLCKRVIIANRKQGGQNIDNKEQIIQQAAVESH